MALGRRPVEPSLPPSVAGERVVVLGRPGCHLCDEAVPVVAAVTAELGLGYAVLDIDEHPQLLAAYGDEIPVVFVGGRRHSYWKVDAARLRSALT